MNSSIAALKRKRFSEGGVVFGLWCGSVWFSASHNVAQVLMKILEILDLHSE